jgi:hypothetical protein
MDRLAEATDELLHHWSALDESDRETLLRVVRLLRTPVREPVVALLQSIANLVDNPPPLPERLVN